jgi:hypothetical protein
MREHPIIVDEDTGHRISFGLQGLDILFLSFHYTPAMYQANEKNCKSAHPNRWFTCQKP